MIGSTNSQGGGAFKGEKLNLSLRTNQASHDDLLGAIITVSHEGGDTQYVWEGDEMTIDVFPYMEYSVTFSDVPGYKTPDALTGMMSQPGNSRSYAVEYQAEKVQVTLQTDDGEAVTGQKVTVNGQELAYEGAAVSVLVPIGTEYSVSADAKEYYATPAAVTRTASLASYGVSMEYKANKLLLAIESNQADDAVIAAVRATVAWGDTSLQTGDGETVRIPVDTEVTVTFPEVEGYKTPEPVSLTNTSGTVEKSGTYLTEVAVVTLSATDGTDVSGQTVTIDGTEYVYAGSAVKHKVPFGKEYTVSVNEKDGFATPDSQTYTASGVTREIAFEYNPSSVKVNILSNQSDDSTIGAVKATLAYGDVSVEVGNGESVAVDKNVSVTITFPDVEGYKTPEAITFTHAGGLSEKTATYYTEKVLVNVTSDEGELVDGQIITVTKKKIMEYVPDYAAIDEYGVAIMDIYGKFYPDAASWQAAGSPAANGVAVSDGTHRFCIAKDIVENVCNGDIYGADSEYWGAYGTTVSGVTTTVDSNTAKADFNGVANTDAIVANVTSSDGYFTKAPWSAAGLCRQFAFPNGAAGYLGACGEWMLVFGVKSTVNTLLAAIGGTQLQFTNSGSIYSYYWSSTQYDSSDAWYWNFIGESCKNGYKHSALIRVRAFSALETIYQEDTDEETRTVSGGKAEFKVAHDLEYTVSANDKTGYATPASQTFVADLTLRNVNMEYVSTLYTDLSKQDVHGNPILQTSANCYVVKEAGYYKIPIAYGAALKNGVANTEAYTNNGGANSHDFVNYLNNAITSPYIETDTGTEAISVQLSISDTDGVVTGLGMKQDEDCKYVRFQVTSVPATGANAVISVKDAEGTIMWSWHIWLWADDLTPVEIVNSTSVAYGIMPVNLASKWDDDAHTYIKNWFYQFGRPNPILCPAAYDSSENHASFGELSFATASAATNLQMGIKNPTTCYDNESNYYNWFSTNGEKTYNLWDAGCSAAGNSDNDVKKTVYDPCPIGFRMPNGNTFTYFSTSNVVGSFANGWKFKRYSGDTTGIFFPASGCRDSSPKYVGSGGYVWLSSAYSQYYAYNLSLGSGGVTPQNYSSRVSGLSVRPVADTSIQGQNKRTKIRIDQTITDPEAMISRIVDLGGIETIRENSHRYTGTFADGVMTLKQLDDTDGTKYADGTTATLTTVGTDVWMKLPQFHWKCSQYATDVWDFEVVYGAKPDDTYHTWDGNDLIGVYEAYNSSSKVYSVSGQTSTGSVSQANFKTYARARGDGFTIVKWKHHCMMAMLYYTMYGHTNCQAKVGLGTSSYTKTTGATNSLGMTDTVGSGGNGDSMSINFWGLENWWGNKFEWIDNVVVDARVWSVTEDDGTVRTAGTGGSSDGWIKKLLLGEQADMIPTVVGGSETTGFCDYYYQSSSTARVVLRSYRYSDTYGGVAYAYANDGSSYTISSYGSRLAFRGTLVVS